MGHKWQQVWKGIDWGSRIQFLWWLGMWIFTHTIQTAIGAAMIAIIWAYLIKISPVFVGLAGLFAFGCVLWIGNNIGSWLERRKRFVPVSNTNIKESTIGKDSASPKLSLEQIEARGAFIRSLQAVAEHLHKYTQSSYTNSAFSIFSYVTYPVGDEIKKRIVISIAMNLLNEKLQNLAFQTSVLKDKVEELTYDIPASEIPTICSETRNLVFEYQKSVKVIMQFLIGLEKGGIKPNCDSPAGQKINTYLSEDYNELIRLVKDLRKDTHKDYKSLLPEDIQLDNFNAIYREIGN